MKKNIINNKLKYILFQSKINKIKNDFWKKYWLKFFELKTIILKILSFILIGIFVLGLSFGIRDLMLTKYPNKVVLNSGVSFSLFSNIGELGIQLIQIIPVCFLFVAFIFVNDWFLILAIPFALFGGLSNFIDRFLNDNYIDSSGQLQNGVNTVVDYIKGINSIFNIPDIFIVFGIISLLIGIVSKIIINNYKDEKNTSKRQLDSFELNDKDDIETKN